MSPTSRFTLSPILILATILCLFPLVSAASGCTRFADYDSINQMFIDGGPGTKVLLCPRKTYRLSGTVVFTAADQELATYGYPTGNERAILRVESTAIATAVQGDCRRCARVAIRNIIIDGNRAKLGRVQDADAATGLIVLGGNEGQSVRDSWITDPRGFTAIHIREGDKLQCQGAVVERNEIGPVGEEFDPSLDGPDPEMSPLGRPLADGISIACRDALVKDNVLWDNTDASIVLYCSPGTEVTSNKISTRRLGQMAGILMVDATPFEGDYSGLKIHGNTIDAAARIIRVGIGIGASVWSDDVETVLRGGSVTSNFLRGGYMGFGIAAGGLKEWTIKDNLSQASHRGKKSARCFDDPINPDPMAFLFNSETIVESDIQADFVDQEFAYIVCIDGVEDKSNPPPAQALPIEVVEPVPEEPVAPAAPSTGSEVMDDILLHSQQRMLEAIEGLGRSVDLAIASHAGSGGGVGGGAGGQLVLDGEDAGAAIGRLQARLDGLEAEQTKLLNAAMNLRKFLSNATHIRVRHEDWQTDVLDHVRQQLRTLIPTNNPSTGNGPGEPEHWSSPYQRDRAGRASNSALLSTVWHAQEGAGGGWAQVGRWIVAQSVFALVVVLGRRWYTRRAHTKIL